MIKKILLRLALFIVIISVGGFSYFRFVSDNMKKGIQIIIIVLFGIQTISAQENLTKTEKINSTIKIWGFLKYYHPHVAKGTFDWEDHFVNLLPEAENAKDKEALSQIYIEWINTLGKVKDCKSCKDKSSAFDKNLDLSWINDSSLFSKELSQQLNHIKNNRFQDNSHYVSIARNQNIKIINSSKVNENDFPDRCHRLLCLAEYWNIIEYFFPYKYLTDQNWNDVLSDMTPKFENAANLQQYQNVLHEIVAKIDDSHGEIITSKKQNKHIPAIFKCINDEVVITSFYNDSLAHLNDLKIGDVITEINSFPIIEVAKERSKYVSASNWGIKLRKTSYDLLNDESDNVQITIERGVEVKNINVIKYSFQEFDYYKPGRKRKWEVVHGNIGYVNMGEISEDDISIMMAERMKCKAIIFDLRNRPKFIYRSISHYLNADEREFAKFTRPDLSYPGRFIWTEMRTTGTKNKDYYKGKVVLLVDEHTLSLGEFTCMSFQTAENVTTIGSQTAGADGDVSQFTIPGGFLTQMTGLGVYYPDGTQTQRVGVKIDILAQRSVKGISQGKDEVYDKAIEIINDLK